MFLIFCYHDGMDKEQDLNQEFVKTTVYINRRLYDSVKMLTVLTHKSMSQIVRVALKEKVDKMHGKK